MVILRQAQDDKRFVMVSLSSGDGAGSADCPSINSGQAISSPFDKLRMTLLGEPCALFLNKIMRLFFEQFF